MLVRRLGLGHAAAGRLMRRDRTTVAHAVRVVDGVRAGTPRAGGATMLACIDHILAHLDRAGEPACAGDDPAVAAVLQRAAAFGGLDVIEIVGGSQSRAVQPVRSAAMWVMRRRLGLDAARIALCMRRSRAGVWHAVGRVDAVLAGDEGADAGRINAAVDHIGAGLGAAP